MAFLNRDMLLQERKLAVERVDLDNGDFVYVREMTGAQREAYEFSLFREERGKSGSIELVPQRENWRAKLLVQTLCDENGNLILSPDDAGKLNRCLGAAMLNKLADIASRLNGLSEMEEQQGNSDGGTVAASCSVSA